MLGQLGRLVLFEQEDLRRFLLLEFYPRRLVQLLFISDEGEVHLCTASHDIFMYGLHHAFIALINGRVSVCLSHLILLLGLAANIIANFHCSFDRRLLNGLAGAHASHQSRVTPRVQAQLTAVGGETLVRRLLLLLQSIFWASDGR